MKIKVIEKGKNKLKIEVDGTSHTLLNLVREKAWAAGAKQASYMIEHPYMATPKVIIFADNPKKVLANSVDMIIKDVGELRKNVKKALK